MKLKHIQINIYKGKYLDSLILFLKKENPDFISMQEVTWGFLNHFEDKEVNLFEKLKDSLSMEGVCNFDWKVKGNVGSLGNAVFSKFPIIDYKVTVLREPKEIDFEFVESEKGFPEAPRHFIDAICRVNNANVHVMSWHGAWTAPPVDTNETLRQSGIVRRYVDELNSNNAPFLIGCDLNSTMDKKTVRLISEVTNNLMIGKQIKQTTHPEIHKIAPRGFLVDYIFISKHFRSKSLHVPEIIVSDHLPVIAELELKES